MIKNILLSLAMLIASSSLTYAQVLPLESNDIQKPDQEMVMQHKDVELKVGSLTIHAPFLYKGEFAPHQGYLIKFKDYIRLQDIVVGSQMSNKALIEVIQKGYNEKLLKCQSDCDLRVKSLQDEKDLLLLEQDALLEKVESIKSSRTIWAITSVVVGAGVGVLVYEIAR